MAEVHAAIACHRVREGMHAVRLPGGPWDGKEVGVGDPSTPFVRVNGPRHGQHSVWITHLYERRGDRYEFVSTEVIPFSAWKFDWGIQSFGFNGNKRIVADSPPSR